MYLSLRRKKERMSKWYKVEDAEDVEISEDGKTVEVMFNTDYAGNCYVEIPVEMLNKQLAAMQADRADMLALLKAIEWCAEINDEAACPSCGCWKDEKHNPNCKLDAMIKKLENTN
jgi:hypothetical protein